MLYIYGALLIPIIVAIYLYKFHAHKTVWWEFAIPFIVSALTILIFKGIAEHSQTSDTEYWSGIITRTQYVEEWSEWIEDECSCCCDEDGFNCTTWDCSYERVHSEYWNVIDNNGITLRVDKERYNYLVRKFEIQPKFVDMNRWYCCGNDGDKYQAFWPGSDRTVECMVTRHEYENRVQVAKDVFNYPEVPEEDIVQHKLYDYPKIHTYWKQNNILGKVKNKARHQKQLELLNAKLGKKKQLKLFVIIFRNEPRETAHLQEALWKGGNKNEFNVAIGLNDDDEVQWCHPFSWTENQITKVETRDFIEEQKTLNMETTIRFLYEEMDKTFIRKPFVEFSYLAVEPTTGQVIAAYIITLLVNVFLSMWIIGNPINEDSGRRYYRGYGRRY